MNTILRVKPGEVLRNLGSFGQDPRCKLLGSLNHHLFIINVQGYNAYIDKQRDSPEYKREEVVYRDGDKDVPATEFMEEVDYTKYPSE